MIISVIFQLSYYIIYYIKRNKKLDIVSIIVSGVYNEGMLEDVLSIIGGSGVEYSWVDIGGTKMELIGSSGQLIKFIKA